MNDDKLMRKLCAAVTLIFINFLQATNQGNLNLLMYLCNKISPGKVFTSSLPLQTHLSMIQQMATELVGSTEVKLK